MKFENSTYIDFLVSLSKQNRTSAFLIIAEIYLKVIYNTVKKILNDESLTKEVCVKTFKEAWHTIGDYNDSTPFSLWLKNIAVPFALKKINLKEKKSDNDLTSQDLFLTELDIEYAISILPGINRVVYILHDIERYNFYEITLLLPDYDETEIQNILVQSRMQLISLIKL